MDDGHTDNQKLDNLLEMVQFIKDHGASQASVDELRDDMKGEISGLRKEMNEEISGLRKEMNEGFENLGDEFRSELRDVRKELEEIKTKLDALEKTAMEDTTAIGGNTIKLHTHIQILEKRVQRLENAQKEHA